MLLNRTNLQARPASAAGVPPRPRPVGIVGLLMFLLMVGGCSAADSPAGESAASKLARGSRPPALSLGLNVSAVASIYPEIPFVDAFKESQPWTFEKIGAPFATPVSGLSSVDENGWVKTLAPGERARACVFQDGSGHFPGGVYTLLYDGRGALSLTGRAVVVSNGRGEMRVMVSPGAGVRGPCIVESSTDAADPIRNIRFIMPGFEKIYLSQPFYPPLLNEFKPFQVVRFLNWARANRSEVVNWSDRRAPSYATQAIGIANTRIAPPPAVTLNDVALEYQIDFANALGLNPWFVTPTKASDDYIRHMAELVHRRLRPDLHPMIEFSNEIWNGGFSDYQYARMMGLKLNLDPDSLPEKTNAGFYWYAMRATQMFDIWNEVYGPDAHRITHVIAGQQSWPRESEIILGYKDTYKKADVLAVAGYVTPVNFYHIHDPARFAEVARLTVDQVMDRLSLDMDRVQAQWASEKSIADKFGLGLVVYEGGFDFSASRAPPPYRQPIAQLYAAATRDPRMGEQYANLLRRASAVGVTLFNHFNDVGAPGIYGSWGALEYQDQDPATSAKYMALVGYSKAHPIRWGP